MDIEPLEQALQRSPDNDVWVDTLARYFLGHDLYYGHGTDNASDEAYWLLRHLQQWRDDPWEAPPDPSLARRAAELAVRRARERIPLAYLINEAWFAGLKFFVDPRVLVPRSPCAELIERAFEPWCRLRPGDRVLDIGTGSDCGGALLRRRAGGCYRRLGRGACSCSGKRRAARSRGSRASSRGGPLSARRR